MYVHLMCMFKRFTSGLIQNDIQDMMTIKQVGT